MKFAKCLGSALEGVKKMLNLITAQVSTRRPKQDGQKPTKPHVQTLKTLTKDALKRHFSNIKQIQPKKVNYMIYALMVMIPPFQTFVKLVTLVP